MIFNNLEHIDVVQRFISNGITEPLLASAENLKFLVIKTHNNPETDIVIFNEYFFYRLAQMLNIPMPESGIGYIDKSTQIYNDCILEDRFGLCFYSTYLNKAFTLNRKISDKIENKKDLCKIILFDHIIYNPDRNIGNLLIQYTSNGSFKVYAIDHTHVLVGQSLWNSVTLEQAMKNHDYYSDEILVQNKEMYSKFIDCIMDDLKDLKSMTSIFKKKITESSLRQILNEIPTELVPDRKNTEAMIKYLLYRVAHIDDICNVITKFFNIRREV